VGARKASNFSEILQLIYLVILEMGVSVVEIIV